MTTPASRDPLQVLASAYGVETAYRGRGGEVRAASPDALVATLQAMGAECAGPADAADALRTLEVSQWERAVEPTIVAWDGAAAAFEVRLPQKDGDALLDFTLETEAGERLQWRVRVGDLPAVRTSRVGRPRRTARIAELPHEMPLGYHRLTLAVQGRIHTATVVAAPTRGARSRAAGSERAWGGFLPLYALRTERDWGCGDFTDFAAMARWLGAEGAQVVATLPLLAGFSSNPCEPSPYAPVSRKFWHELWIDVERVPEVQSSAAARAMLGDPELRSGLAALREAPFVDHEATMRAKRPVLAALAAGLADAPPAREAAFRNFLLDRPEVSEYARFRAAGERFGTDWRSWPTQMRNGVIRWADVDPAIERYYRYTQWIAEEQIADLARDLDRRGQALYLDLPLGCHPDGYDVWRNREQFAPGVSAGAPPDPFFTAGQDWGFPPLHPQRIRQDAHRHLRDCLAHHLRHARLLRLDHVMSLHRLFWVPHGFPAAEGVYVRMPTDELYAVTCLEAARHGADIVGENLGTLPSDIGEWMARHGLRGMSVTEFGILPDADPPMAAPSPDEVASISTHDLPTFAGWWQDADLDDRVDLGLLDADEEARERAERAEARRALRRYAYPEPAAAAPAADDEAAPAGEQQGEARLAAETADDAVPPPPRAVLDAVQGALAASPSELVLLNVEDLFLEAAPQNVPGTFRERPNWRRKAARTLSEIATDPDVAASLAMVRAARLGAPGAVPAPAETGGAATKPETVFGISLLSEDDLHLFNEGRHFRLHTKLGAHPLTVAGAAGTYFAVWAPNAEKVSVIGDFNGWDPARHPLRALQHSGIWEGFVPGVGRGAVYKYRIRSRVGGYEVEKADPFAFASEVPPRTASIVWDLDHEWRDDGWMAARGELQGPRAPMSVYEVHLGSWRRVPEDADRPLGFREIARPLAEHCAALGFTHVELLPVMEHPFYGSWGYQVTGYFAPTARYGTPQDLMFLVETLHEHGIGVILDWVPSHFPADEHGLAFFDGTHLYEHADPRLRVHPDWDSWLFNYGRNEVRSFLVSNAVFWLERYHADGLRVDAVASMLYLDYSREAGEWIPNRYGGNEDLDALEFLRQCNSEVYRTFPDTVTIAEESTAWPGVTRPVHLGGLGFGFKWDMGWMHDTLRYFAHDPVHRRYHHDDLTFRGIYAATENFVLPLSHDEVVHGKGSLLAKMPGDDWQRHANLRTLYGLQWATTGKKLLFMGGELAQWNEWSHESSLDWHLLEFPRHAGCQRWVTRLNALLKEHPALSVYDCDPRGFEWIDCHDHEQSTLSLLRRGEAGEAVAVVCNFTPVPRDAFRIGVPSGGPWRVIASSDDAEYGGSGFPMPEVLEADGEPWHDRPHSLELRLPPLAVVFLAPANGGPGTAVTPGDTVAP